MIYECFHVFILLFISLYIGLFVSDIPIFIKDIITNIYMRIIIIFLFFFKENYDVVTSFIIAISLIMFDQIYSPFL
jgi:hypothetical protein